jgi:antitoxin YefM
LYNIIVQLDGITVMELVSYSYLRQHLSELLDKVVDDSEVLHIRRKNGRRIVVMEESEYESLIETIHVFSTEANTKRIVSSLADAKKGKGVEIDVQDYFNS